MHIEIKENILLAPYTVFKIGGRARFLAEIESVEELKEAVNFAETKDLPVFVLGEGSNIVVSDVGFSGLVLRNKFPGINYRGETSIVAGGGENWDKFVEFAVTRNLAGAECLSGIPGTVGAAPVQNIGAYGQSVGESVESVEAVDLETGREAVFDKKQCEFGYRTSLFKKNPGKYFITSVTFGLKKGGMPTLVYHDLKNYFSGNPDPTLAEVRKAVLEIRSRKGMVVTGEELHTSVGSFFTNPVVSADLLEKLKPTIEKCQKEKGCCAPSWFWQKTDGRIKISAACLVECAGFKRGMKRGRAGISSLHSLALANLGGAQAEEIMALAEEVCTKVREKFGINLEIEPQLVGF